MIKYIIFDIGNVLLEFKPLNYLADLFLEEKICAELHEQIFRSPEWLLLDRGTITQEKVLEILSLRHPENADKIKISFQGWMDILTPKIDSIEIVKKLHVLNYKLFLLSNFHKDAFELIENKYDFFKLFEGGIISYKEKLLKPEIEIYKVLLKKYNIKANEALFIDDTIENVEGAKEAGINAIVFKDSQGLIKDLKSFNIIVN